ncbi:hypothetical protein ACPCIR_16755 [Mycobacterium sp. NPDC051198]
MQWSESPAFGAAEIVAQVAPGESRPGYAWRAEGADGRRYLAMPTGDGVWPWTVCVKQRSTGAGGAWWANDFEEAKNIAETHEANEARRIDRF